MDNVDTLIDAYIDHTIDDEQFEALCDWLREDPANRQAFARKLALHSEIAEWCVERSGSPLAGDPEATHADAATQPHTWVDELAQLDGPASHAAPSDDAGSLSAHELAAVTGYALRLVLTSKSAKRIYAYAGIAAAVLLALVLLGPWGGNETPTNAPLATDQRNTPAESAPPIPRDQTVATLTAQHDAQWSSQPGGDHRPGALRPGTQLTAGQRLTLTAGFAEITTAQGAEVLLQAPCSIEMTGGDNALRLVRGELSARVDTVRAQGFTVYLPQNSRIVDLGTAFRVAVDASGRADCLVTEGKVLWQPDDQDDASALIVAGQTARLVDGRPVVSDVVEVFAEDFDGYTAAEENFYDEGQLDTGLRVAYLGSLPGWKHTGFHSIHAVDHANPVGNYTNTPDYAAMVIYGRMETAVSGANEAGQQYEVSYLAGPAVYKERDHRTTADDRLLIELVRRDGTVLTSHTHRPGDWAGRMALYPDRFTYRGDGSGALTLRIHSADAGLHDITSETGVRKYDNPQFAGAIDDLSIRVIDASTNSTTDRGNEQP